MSNDSEKLVAINRLLASVDRPIAAWAEKLQAILNEPNLTEVNVEANGYGTVRINGDVSAIIPFTRLRELNREAASSCQSEAAKSLVRNAKLQINSGPKEN